MNDEIQTVETEVEEKPQEVSLREQLLAAQEEIETRDSTENEGKVDDKPKVAVTQEKPNISEVATKTAEEQKPTVHEIEPPNSWNKQAKEAWASIPTETRAYIAQREADMHRALSAQDELKSAGKAIRDVVAPFSELFQSMPNVSPPQLIEGYLRTEQTLQRGTPEQKAMLLSNVIQQYGIDLNILGAALQGQVQQPQYLPQVDQLTKQVQTLEQYIQQQQEATKLSVIDKFIIDKNIDLSSIGDKFLNEVSLVANSNPKLSESEILEQAYERYQWLDPSQREQLINKQVGTIAQDTAKKKELDRAKRAGKSVSGSPGSGTQINAPASTLRGELERQFSGFDTRV